MLIGEAALLYVQEDIRSAVDGDPDVFHLGPDQIVVALSLEFKDDRSTEDLEDRVKRIEARLKQRRSDIASVFCKAADLCHLAKAAGQARE